jgi:hypothetical protein
MHTLFVHCIKNNISIDSKVISKTFKQGCAIDCSESGNPQKVSFSRARDIMIRLSTAFLEYQTVILRYHDYGNRSAAKIVFLKKVFVPSIQRHGIVKTN